MKIDLTNLEINITHHKRWNKNIKNISCKHKTLLCLCTCQCFDKKLSWQVTVLSMEEGTLLFFEDTNVTSLYRFLLFVDCPLWKFCSSKTNQKCRCHRICQLVWLLQNTSFYIFSGLTFLGYLMPSVYLYSTWLSHWGSGNSLYLFAIAES